MGRPRIGAVASAVAAAGMFFVWKTGWAQPSSQSTAPLALKLRVDRSSPTDLEIGGDVKAEPGGATWYLTRADLLALPQTSFTVGDDSNFFVPTRVSGVRLEDLQHDIGAPGDDMVIAICKDKYRAHYPRAYLAEHHPLLVLEIDGKPPSGWPKDSDGHGFDMGPYMITHRKFFSASQVRAHADEAQIPWGVVRLEFRDEKLVFGAIAPPGPFANRPAVEAGYQLARQSCFRCHDAGDAGERKSGVSWEALSAIAAASPDFFAAYVRSPKSKNPQSQMPANPQYDDLTLDTLTAYFRSFSQPGRP
jgi:mono/diheme cytochrome c family protein